MPVGQDNRYMDATFTGETDTEPRAYSKTVLVRFWGTEGGEAYGEVIHWNLLKPVPFKGIPELLQRIDGVADYLGLFGEGSPSGSPGVYLGAEGRGLPAECQKIIPTRQRARDGFCRETYLKRARRTVRVELLGRCHKGIQGRIHGGTAGREPVYFCSTWEFMGILAGTGRP
ncbi:hypothetical protein D3Z51_19635 [Clostridiaceae bacterium]|nr:hypothetical protein [Clostridiaceae bacterium]RKI07849.1 hypothetical protein D7V81_19675 [bacterium 1XD21-70]